MTKPTLTIPIGGVNIRSENRDLIVMVDTGANELVEVLRVRGCWNEGGTVDDTITALGILDAIHGLEQFSREQTRIKYEP